MASRGERDQLRTAHIDGQLDVAAEPFGQDDAAAQRPFPARHVNVAGPQPHPDTGAAFAAHVLGYRHVEGTVAQPDASVVDDTVEQVDLGLTESARHERVGGAAPDLL